MNLNLVNKGYRLIAKQWNLLSNTIILN